VKDRALKQTLKFRSFVRVAGESGKLPLR
jgi:hypothetical protein